jgi:four helix bundle protein
MDRKDLEQRTLRFAVAVIEFVGTLPKNKTGEVVEFQLVKAGTSIGANYRESGRAESTNDFIHKLAIVEKESAESCFWLELCDYAQLGDSSKRKWLLKESRELLAISRPVARPVRQIVPVWRTVRDSKALHSNPTLDRIHD